MHELSPTNKDGSLEISVLSPVQSSATATATATRDTTRTTSRTTVARRARVALVIVVQGRRSRDRKLEHRNSKTKFEVSVVSTYFLLNACKIASQNVLSGPSFI